MKHSDIFSKEWCDLVFENRNREYGAYKIRKNAGRRQRFALLVVFFGTLLIILPPIVLRLYTKYQIVKSLKGVEADIKQLKQLDHKDGFEMKQMAAGRGAPRVSTLKGATEAIPDVVEVTKQDIRIGVTGPEDFFIEETTLFDDIDTLHNRERLDLPIEGPQLTAVEVVEEMPQYPGGLTALMTWLEAHIPYPPSCIRQKIEGDMEVTFLIDSTGSVIEPQVYKPLHPDLDNVALGALRIMPRWNPGRENGRVAIVRITLPLHFQLK